MTVARVCATFKDLSCYLSSSQVTHYVSWLVGGMSELVTSRLAAAGIHGDAHVDRDDGGHDVDCEEVIDGARSRAEPVLGIWFLL